MFGGIPAITKDKWEYKSIGNIQPDAQRTKRAGKVKIVWDLWNMLQSLSYEQSTSKDKKTEHKQKNKLQKWGQELSKTKSHECQKQSAMTTKQKEK